MSVTIDGTSLVFDGTVTVTNFSNPAANGVCTLTLTPMGGVGSFPALAAGESGQPALITSLVVNTLSPGDSATGSLSLTSAGGAGTSSEYELTLGIPQGATGSSSAFALSDGTDLSGTAAVGDIVTVASITPTEFAYTAFPFGDAFNATSGTDYSVTGIARVTLRTISIPAQTFDYYPICFAECVVEGTANTVVYLEACLNSSTGNIVGRCKGMSGVANQQLVMIPAFGASISGSGYGKVSAGDPAEIFLVAAEVGATGDSWSIDDDVTDFTAMILPVAS